MIDRLLFLLVGLIAVGIPAVYLIRYRRHLAASRRKQADARSSGLTEPVSLHPVIDPVKCICSAGCTAACPEGGILGITGGGAELVTPTKCIGHGACAEACPVDAISLVFGTEKRGVDIPHVSETFETNVEGIYIAGELGGMGLIRNAVTQGREAVEYIAQSLEPGRGDGADLIIVGAGPAGLAAALQAKKEGLSAVILEQGDGVGGTLLSYPRQKLVMTQPMEIPLHGSFQKREVRKEELLKLWTGVAEKHAIRVHHHEKVESVVRGSGGFTVTTGRGEHVGQRVLLAIGRRGTPRRLGVPGEDSSKVTYRMIEPEQYAGRKVLVVGGGDSAVEAAVTLSEQKGTVVTLSYRKDVFGRIKQGNQDRIRETMDAGRVRAAFSSQVRSIAADHIVLAQGDDEIKLENDYVIVAIGGELPTGFLQNIGVRMEKKFGQA